MSEPCPRRVEELFDRALDRDAADVAAFLDEECAGDAVLRGAVEELLRLDGQAEASGSLLRSPVGETRLQAPAPPAPLPPRVARYRVVGVLGEGGMGTVYEAEQDNPRRTVALKVIRAGLTSESLRKRFAREAQILGRLRHPGIAQVYDAGVADGGQPYFAMELVAGVPPDQYAREHSLGRRGRLELVARVCDAVQHAHEHGVVHRDLKPGNILVEASGQPKVLDFGVARAADAGVTAGGAHTETGQLIGTLGYMSPEQVLADPSAVDARSDVYALGVILYELLAHRPPYGLDRLPLPEAARVIREQEPSRLGSLDGGLRGDVETIVAKALEKDKARRYATAGELAADLRRHLNNEPIRARPASAFYQLRKFARRNKVLVGGAAGVAAALAAGTVVSALYAIRADINARAARENARQAGENERSARYNAYRARLAAAAAALSHHDVEDAARQLRSAPEELRGWEWHHLHARLDDSDATFPAFGLWPRGASGFALASILDRTLTVTDEEGGRLSSSPRLDRTPRRTALHIAGDGTWLLVMVDPENQEKIRLRGPADPDRFARLDPGNDGVAGTAFSPDGKRLAVIGHDRSIRLCDVASGRQTAHWAREPTECNALAFSADGRRLAVAADSPVVSVWDAEAGRVVAELRTLPGRVLAAAFHPRGDRLVTGSLDGGVRQWDLRTGREAEPTYERHHGEVWAVAYSPDGLRVASAGEDHTVRVWRAEGRQDEAILHGHTRTVNGLAFSRDGRRLASIDQGDTVRLWDTGPGATLPVLRGHASYVYPVTYTPDGRRIASGAWDGTVRLWDAVTGEQVASLSSGRFVRALAVSPDGSRLVAMGDGAEGLCVWDVASARQIATYKTVENRLWAAAFRPDGAHVAVLGSGRVIEVLDATTGGRVAAPDAGNLEPWAVRRALAYSPDGRLLAGPYEGNQVGLWEAETYRLVGTLAGHAGTVLSLAFSADGRLLASGGADAQIRVWDVETRYCRLTLRGHADEVFAAVFHPDGSRIASGGRDRLVRLWDSATGEELVRLPGHSNYVFDLAFSPDGKTLVSSSGDFTLRLWDTEPRQARSRARRAAEATRPKAG